MTRPLSEREIAFIKANTGKHACACGCGGTIKILPRHAYGGIPSYLDGHYMATQSSRYSPEKRFWKRIVKGDLCWGWSGSKTSSGYGAFNVKRKNVQAHRFSYELHHGPIPADLLVCHHCDNPPCCNPDHLFVGTSKDNVADRDRKGRQARQRGELCGTAKLTEVIVRMIRERYAKGGVTMREFAVEFKVSQTSISRVIRRERWSHC